MQSGSFVHISSFRKDDLKATIIYDAGHLDAQNLGINKASQTLSPIRISGLRL